MEDRIWWRGQNESQIGAEEKKNGRLVIDPETRKGLGEWRRLQRKKLSTLGLPKRKEWPQCHRDSSWQVRQSCFRQKDKEQSHLSKAPNRKVGES